MWSWLYIVVEMLEGSLPWRTSSGDASAGSEHSPKETAQRLKQEITSSDAIAIMKVGQHFDKIRGVLNELGLAGQATIIERATRDDEKITPLADVPEGERPYFSTILIYKGGESW